MWQNKGNWSLVKREWLIQVRKGKQLEWKHENHTIIFIFSTVVTFFLPGIPSFCICHPWCFTREPSPFSFSFPLAGWKIFHLQFHKYPVPEVSYMYHVCQNLSVSVTGNKRDTEISKKQRLPWEVGGVEVTVPPPLHTHFRQTAFIYHTNTSGHVKREYKQL